MACLTMRFWSLCELLLLLFLYAVPGLAVRARQPRKVDGVTRAHIKNQSLGQVPAWPSKPPPSSKTALAPRPIIIPRTLARRDRAFCRPKSCGSGTGKNCPASTSAKGSAQTLRPKGGRLLYILTPLAAVLLLSSNRGTRSRYLHSDPYPSDTYGLCCTKIVSDTLGVTLL